MSNQIPEHYHKSIDEVREGETPTLEFAFTQSYYHKAEKKNHITMFFRCNVCQHLFYWGRNLDTGKDGLIDIDS